METSVVFVKDAMILRFVYKFSFLIEEQMNKYIKFENPLVQGQSL